MTGAHDLTETRSHCIILWTMSQLLNYRGSLVLALAEPFGYQDMKQYGSHLAVTLQSSFL